MKHFYDITTGHLDLFNEDFETHKPNGPKISIGITTITKRGVILAQIKTHSHVCSRVGLQQCDASIISWSPLPRPEVPIPMVSLLDEPRNDKSNI